LAKSRQISNSMVALEEIIDKRSKPRTLPDKQELLYFT